ncbi:MAG: HD-GYP domain-containing protein [Actinomycetota bacterium]
MSWLRRPGVRVFLASWFVLVPGQVVASLPPIGEATWTAPLFLFWAVVIAAGLCIVTSVVVLISAHRSEAPELGMIGGFLMSVSVLPFVHGLTTPGVLYEANNATLTSILLAIPIGTTVASPLLVPYRPFGRFMLRRWRAWVGAWTALVSLLGIALLASPDLLPAPTMASPAAIAIGVCSLGGCLALSIRQLRLSWISGDSGSLIVVVAYALIGTSTLVWIGDRPYNAGFWMAHAVDVLGVFAGCLGAWMVARRTGSTARVLAPIRAAEPISALELGLEPVVHRFVADLERKDAATRDHVVRTAELAMRIGGRMGVPADQLRELGVGALLHDVGKIEIPDEVLNKPGRLDDDEFEIMKSHAAIGRRMLEDTVGLRDVAPIVGGHHERWDGRGYPGRLAGEDIPLAARIVSACDAFDAMAQNRVYREGMGMEKALAILDEHAGSQWDARVVEALKAELADADAPPEQRQLAGVGRGDLGHDHEHFVAACDCVDALPEELVNR